MDIPKFITRGIISPEKFYRDFTRYLDKTKYIQFIQGWELVNTYYIILFVLNVCM